MPLIKNLLANNSYADLEAAFWNIMPLVTPVAGKNVSRRPQCHQQPVDWRERAGLADYLLTLQPEMQVAAAGRDISAIGARPAWNQHAPRVARAYDTRLRAGDFARLYGKMMVAAGLRVANQAICQRPRLFFRTAWMS